MNPLIFNLIKRLSRAGLVGVIGLHANLTLAGEVRYEFDIDYYQMNQTGRFAKALAIGNQIPGPVIKANVGDTLSVTFHNKLNEETSIHWHGVLLPNEQDGVPYLTTPPIKPGTSWTYTFPVTHSGTYWYHSHSGLQEQSGMYGALVFYPNKPVKQSTSEQVLVFSDWSDENPHNIHANLKKSDDYYALKKGTVQSWYQVLKHGSQAVKNRLNGSWFRMGPMDISDVGYDAFLVNGQKQQHINITPGQKIKLRLVNASASSYLKINYAGGPMTIVAADGVDVVPFEQDTFTMAIAETYDVLVTVPDNFSYEFRANAEDGTGYSSTYIGQGPKKSATAYQPPNVYLTSHQHHMAKPAVHNQHMQHSQHQMTNDYDHLRATHVTAFDNNMPLREVRLELTGFMERYFWSFNDTPLSESEKILINKGERVRFILVNRTMMHHPIHLHGHFFRVINKNGDYSPLKHTVNVPAMGEQVIEFAANEDQDWFFHCHNLYHMKSGMSRVISYGDNKELGPYLQNNLAHDDKWFSKAELAFLYNMTAGEAMLYNNNNALVAEYDWDWSKRYDAEVYYQRYITRFLSVFVGGNFEREHDDEESENKAIIGIHYTLPLLIESQIRLDSNGDARLQLSSDLQLFERLSFEWMVNTDKEYRLGLHYNITQRFMLAAIQDSDYHFGVGVKLLL